MAVILYFFTSIIFSLYVYRQFDTLLYFWARGKESRPGWTSRRECSSPGCVAFLCKTMSRSSVLCYSWTRGKKSRLLRHMEKNPVCQDIAPRVQAYKKRVFYFVIVGNLLLSNFSFVLHLLALSLPPYYYQQY